ncbi:MAG: CBS domain-containing protein [Nitrospinota bacterium]|nr:CBS domain-containing protein [Nitrospinota bacterium]MDH5679819.1 CBS domain-containing protein [Nitrospinota bacterium]MDH5757562.1 CBS domain-containing protein [Nitrospinota bacterium]
MYATKISELSTSQVLSVPSKTSLADSLKVLTENKISCLVVVEDNKPVGLLTERDVVKIAKRHRQIGELSIRDVMSSPVITVPGNMDILDLYGLFRKERIRHSVVVGRDDKIEGIVTLSDIITRLGLGLIDRRSVRHIMTKGVIKVPAEASMAEVVRKMEEFSISCVVMEKERQPSGVITERDIPRILMEATDLDNSLAERWMSAPLDLVEDVLPLAEAVKKMIQVGRRRLVVVDAAGEAVGIITQSDILRGLLEGKYIRFLQGRLDQREAALRQSEARLRAMVASVGEGIVSFGHDNTITFANTEAGKVFGYQAEELVGMGFDRLLSPSSRESLMDGLGSYIHTGGSHWVGRRRELQGQGKLGHEFPLEIRIEEVKTRDEGEKSFIAAFRDITERKLKELETRDIDQEKTSLLDCILQSSRDVAIVATNLGFRISYFNPAAERIFGYPASKVIGQTTMDMRIWENISEPRYKKGLMDVYVKGEHIFTFQRQMEDGPHIFEARVERINGDNGALTGFLLTCKDVTPPPKEG